MLANARFLPNPELKSHSPEITFSEILAWLSEAWLAIDESGGGQSLETWNSAKVHSGQCGIFPNGQLEQITKFHLMSWVFIIISISIYNDKCQYCFTKSWCASKVIKHHYPWLFIHFHPAPRMTSTIINSADNRIFLGVRFLTRTNIWEILFWLR